MIEICILKCLPGFYIKISIGVLLVTFIFYDYCDEISDDKNIGGDLMVGEVMLACQACRGGSVILKWVGFVAQSAIWKQKFQ